MNIEDIKELQMSQSYIPDKIVSFLDGADKNSKVLDIATGKGYLVQLLDSYGYKNLHSADIDENNFRFDKQKFHFLKINANNSLPYRNEDFDIIICSETIEHIENPRNLLKEFHRILKKKGVLILTTPNIETVFSKIYFLFCSGLAAHTENDYKTSGHITVLPSWLIERFAIEIGFKKIDATYNCGYIPIVKIKTKNILLNKSFGWISIYKFTKV